MKISADHPQFQIAVARIREGFTHTLRTYLDQLNTLSGRISASERPSEAFGEVSAIAHRIHGVAHTLSYEDLGRIAAATEAHADAASHDPCGREQIDEGIVRLKALVDCIQGICGNATA